MKCSILQFCAAAGGLRCCLEITQSLVKRFHTPAPSVYIQSYIAPIIVIIIPNESASINNFDISE